MVVVGDRVDLEQVGMIERAHFEQCSKQGPAVLDISDVFKAIEQVVGIGTIAQHNKSGRTMSIAQRADQFVWSKVFVAERCAHTGVAHLCAWADAVSTNVIDRIISIPACDRT